jgi:hypothetical protein
MDFKSDVVVSIIDLDVFGPGLCAFLQLKG